MSKKIVQIVCYVLTYHMLNFHSFLSYLSQKSGKKYCDDFCWALFRSWFIQGIERLKHSPSSFSQFAAQDMCLESRVRPRNTLEGALFSARVLVQVRQPLPSHLWLCVQTNRHRPVIPLSQWHRHHVAWVHGACKPHPVVRGIYHLHISVKNWREIRKRGFAPAKSWKQLSGSVHAVGEDDARRRVVTDGAYQEVEMAVSSRFRAQDLRRHDSLILCRRHGRKQQASARTFSTADFRSQVKKEGEITHRPTLVFRIHIY